MHSKNTKIFGIIGYPLGHTLSPWIHNELFRLSGFDAVYLVWERPDWAQIGLSALRTLSVSGISVTIPYKEWAFQVSTQSCETSQTMKSSNTLLFREDQILAHNTDGEGALRSILETDKHLLDPSDDSSILILGSGGSAKGILYALHNYLRNQRKNDKAIAKKIYIYARNTKASEEMIQSIGHPETIRLIQREELLANPKEFSLVIHTTPVGMKGIDGDPLLPKDFFHHDMALFDIVYNPLETELVHLAKKKNAEIIPGYKMLLYQGIKQFELFSSIVPKQKWIKHIDKILLKQLKLR
ncbi:shikimate dehydrogenase [Leptospira ryugenii]|uniref:Shikimate dehydrogenase n=1 Tax=Leptospira ryugenii TaxID=1917863 RepID=A0A2P2DZZ4_9LEPT|nr:shikimate dehydrogenase [Leptospira ryugenii]GBF50146.1 shikimate dehydrogenase [Leptospira ryugenii]